MSITSKLGIRAPPARWVISGVGTVRAGRYTQIPMMELRTPCRNVGALGSFDREVPSRIAKAFLLFIGAIVFFVDND